MSTHYLQEKNKAGCYCQGKLAHYNTYKPMFYKTTAGSFD